MFHMSEKIKNGGVYFIAEMSANHAGKLENALEIVREAAKAGADCVKIQTYTADSLTIDCDNDYFKVKGGLWDGYKLYDLYKDAGTPYEWQEQIKRECDKYHVDFLSTPFDKNAVDFLENLGCEAYKIASFEMVDLELIQYAASKMKPMIISCGLANIEEIGDAINACFEVGNHDVTILKCCSEYPSNWEDMHLKNIPDIGERFHVNVGLSDHSMGNLGAIVGVTLGASVIEKHFCLSRKIKNPDSDFSMEPAEYKEMVDAVKNAKLIAQGPQYERTEKEESSVVFRRSLFAVKDIKKGELFSMENLQSIRPGYGILPKYKGLFIGKESKWNISRGTPITEIMLKEYRK